jgi:hypothetical protein
MFLSALLEGAFPLDVYQVLIVAYSEGWLKVFHNSLAVLSLCKLHKNKAVFLTRE